MFFGFSSWAKPGLTLPGSEHVEAPLIYADVLYPPETLGQDCPTAAGLRFWVQNDAFHSSQFEEKSRGAMVLAAFHWGQFLTLSNCSAMPRESRPTAHAPRDQEEPRTEGILFLCTTSTAWLCYTCPLPLGDQGCCSCPWWHEVGCKCCSHSVPKDGKITITHIYMHLHFKYLTRQLGKIFLINLYPEAQNTIFFLIILSSISRRADCCTNLIRTFKKPIVILEDLSLSQIASFQVNTSPWPLQKNL